MSTVRTNPHHILSPAWRRVTYAIAIAAFAVTSTSCDNTAKRDRHQAQAMLDRVTSLAANSDYASAKALIDSINTLYPEQIEVRRAATDILPSVIAGLTRQLIADADIELAQAQAVVDELAPQMSLVSGEDKNYYVVTRGYVPYSPIEPRVDADYLTFYIVASTSGRAIGLNSVGLAASDGSKCMSAPIPAGNDRAMSLDGRELAVFLAEEVDSLGCFAANHTINGAILAGASGNRDVKLSTDQAAAMGTAWRYADARQRLQKALVNRERLEWQLKKAQDLDN